MEAFRRLFPINLDKLFAEESLEIEKSEIRNKEKQPSNKKGQIKAVGLHSQKRMKSDLHPKMWSVAKSKK